MICFEIVNMNRSGITVKSGKQIGKCFEVLTVNINRLIERKFRFLVDRGYSYTHIHKKRLFDEFQFHRKSDSISISYDWHCDFLDLTIKDDTKVLFQTSYDCIVVNYLNFENDISYLLKDIYSLSRGSYSLSKEQLVKLIDLYVDCIMLFLNQQA